MWYGRVTFHYPLPGVERLERRLALQLVTLSLVLRFDCMLCEAKNCLVSSRRIPVHLKTTICAGAASAAASAAWCWSYVMRLLVLPLLVLLMAEPLVGRSVLLALELGLMVSWLSSCAGVAAGCRPSSASKRKSLAKEKPAELLKADKYTFSVKPLRLRVAFFCEHRQASRSHRQAHLSRDYWDYSFHCTFSH